MQFPPPPPLPPISLAVPLSPSLSDPPSPSCYLSPDDISRLRGGTYVEHLGPVGDERRYGAGATGQALEGHEPRTGHASSLGQNLFVSGVPK